ncbi:unnamed protein product [Nesidiocoris tenuis]|uniref:Uncharacterized protein n=1 Tax=Nesidiocoris tenuis TaxID=355587 RepID=A0A6H5GAY1_9HEMI|nr:unnamed protein product [Nesidiocoris tenuis]
MSLRKTIKRFSRGFRSQPKAGQFHQDQKLANSTKTSYSAKIRKPHSDPTWPVAGIVETDDGRYLKRHVDQLTGLGRFYRGQVKDLLEVEAPRDVPPITDPPQTFGRSPTRPSRRSSVANQTPPRPARRSAAADPIGDTPAPNEQILESGASRRSSIAPVSQAPMSPVSEIGAGGAAVPPPASRPRRMVSKNDHRCRHSGSISRKSGQGALEEENRVEHRSLTCH